MACELTEWTQMVAYLTERPGAANQDGYGYDDPRSPAGSPEPTAAST